MVIDVIIGILLIIASYLIGSIPCGLLIGKAKGKDLRENGSGNIGSTNAVRTLGLKLGVLSGICDLAKGTVIILLVYLLESQQIWFNPFVINGDSLYALYGVAAVVGHCFPIYLKFKGGKAVATSLGVLFATVPWSAFAALVLFLIAMLITGIVSLSSSLGTLAAWITTFIVYGFTLHHNIASCLVISVLAFLIFFKHIPNYKRLLNGTEYSFKKKKQE